MTGNGLSRRNFLKASAGVVGVGLMAACDAPAAPAGGEMAEESGGEAAAMERVDVHCNLAQLQPTEWTTRSAEHPLVGNAARILAERFEELNPDIAVVFDEAGDDAWLTAAVSSGESPDLMSRLDLVQRGWCVPIDDWLDAPSRYAIQYDTWSDSFYPSMMESLTWSDGLDYCAPIRAIWPYLEVGLACNMEIFNEHGLTPPATWTEQMEVSQALKQAGLGLSPWPREGETGNCWPLALQILPPMMQEVCIEMDADNDFFVGIEEALPAHKAELIGPYTPIYQRAWDEMYALALTWVDGFNTTDLDLLWREGSVGMQYRATWEFATLANDPNVDFERTFVPSPMPAAADIPPTVSMPGAVDPNDYTAGDGNVPAEHVQAIRGPQDVMLKSSTEMRGNRDQVINWWQFITEPENNAFLNNENQQYIPSARDAKLGPLWSAIGGYKLPLYTYTIAWWGMGLLWDWDYFTEWRRIFVAWVIGDMDRAEFFERQQRSWDEGVARYEALLADQEADS